VGGIVVINAAVAKRKRPEGERPDRITLEYYGEAEIALVRRMRVAAVLRGERVRDWVLEAIRQRLEREEEGDAGR